MSIIDDIKRDAKAGTPGPWEYAPDSPQSHDVYSVEEGFHIGAASSGFNVLGMVQANARRIARVPEMEAALIAADELAAAARHYRDFVMDHGASGEVVPLTTEPAHRLMVALRNYTKEIGGDT